MARKGRAFQWQIYPAFNNHLRYSLKSVSHELIRQLQNLINRDNIVNINIYINDIIHGLNDIPIIDDMSDNTIFLKKNDVLVGDNNKN